MNHALLLLCSVILLCLTTPAWAADINAASCSRADVQNAINSAAEGDRVLVPAGTCTWTAQVLVNNKGITLQGAGIGRTVITNGFASNEVLQFNLQAGDPTTYVTGFTFNANRLDTGSHGMIELGGGGLNAFRLHHLEILNLLERGVIVYMDGLEVSGLIDHVTFTMPATSGGSKAISIDGTSPEEHQPFTRPLELGSAKFIFVEDCTFIFGGMNDGAQDAYTGARYVFRHNIVNGTHLEHHGADSGNARGVHSFEIYDNNFICTGGCNSQRKFYLRSGTGVIFNNTFTGSNYGTAELTNYRSDESHAPWGICNGTSIWDENRPGQNGYACLDQIGHIFGPTSGGANTLVPLYEWNNTHDGADVDLKVGSSHANADQHIVEGRDFYNDTPRPGYTPYTYPHPLQSGQSDKSPPAAPTNLRVT